MELEKKPIHVINLEIEIKTRRPQDSFGISRERLEWIIAASVQGDCEGEGWNPLEYR